MKIRASRFLKQVIADLSSMAKSKTLALKSKRNAIKARLIIFSLVMNKKFVISSISHKFQSFLGHHSHPKVEYLLEGVSDMKIQELVEDKDQNDGYESYYKYGEDYDYDYDFDDERGGGKCKYQDFTHTLLDSEDLDLGGPVVDLVKSSKEEARQEFKMEEEIDHMADIFIKKFHRQILLQKQESLKRCQGMLLSGVA